MNCWAKKAVSPSDLLPQWDRDKEAEERVGRDAFLAWARGQEAAAKMNQNTGANG